MLSWRLLPHSGRKFHVREVTPFYKAAPQREHREPRTIPNRGEGGEGRARSLVWAPFPHLRESWGNRRRLWNPHGHLCQGEHPPCKLLTTQLTDPQ